MTDFRECEPDEDFFTPPQSPTLDNWQQDNTSQKNNHSSTFALNPIHDSSYASHNEYHVDNIHHPSRSTDSCHGNYCGTNVDMSTISDEVFVNDATNSSTAVCKTKVKFPHPQSSSENLNSLSLKRSVSDDGDCICRASNEFQDDNSLHFTKSKASDIKVDRPVKTQRSLSTEIVFPSPTKRERIASLKDKTVNTNDSLKSATNVYGDVSRSSSIDIGQAGICKNYAVKWGESTRQHGIVLVSDRQKEEEVIQKIDALGIADDVISEGKSYLHHNFDDVMPRSPVVIHSATNVIQDSLVYLNQTETEDDAHNFITNRERKMSALMKSFHSEENVFMETQASRGAEELLENYFRVVLSGNPGDGKTAIAKHIIVKKSRQGYHCVIINGLADLECIQFNSKSILFLDDVFGVTVFDRSRTEEMQRVFWQLETLLMAKCGDILMVMTSRSHILDEAIKILKNPEFVTKANTDVASSLTDKEKMKIMRKHFGFYHINPDHVHTTSLEEFFNQAVMISPTHGFPHCVQMFVRSPSLRLRGINFFKSPIEHLLQNLNVMRTTKPMEFAFLLYLALLDGKLNTSTCQSSANDRERLKLIRKMVNINDNVDIRQLQQCRSKELETYLNMDHEDIRYFQHPSIQDAVTFIMGEEFLNEILEICSFEFISSKIRTMNYENTSNEKVIRVSRQQYRTLYVRLLGEIRKGNIRDVCFHQAMNDPSFVFAFFQNSALSKSLGDSPLQREINLLSCVQYDVIHKCFGSLLYWSCVANNSPLSYELLGRHGLETLLQNDTAWMQEQIKESFIFTCLHGNDVVLLRRLGKFVEDKNFVGKTTFYYDIFNTLKEPKFSEIFSETRLPLSPLNAAVLSEGCSSCAMIEYLADFDEIITIFSISLAIKLQKHDAIDLLLTKYEGNLDLSDEMVYALKHGDCRSVKILMNHDFELPDLHTLAQEDIFQICSHANSTESSFIFRQDDKQRMLMLALPFAGSVEFASEMMEKLALENVKNISGDIFSNVFHPNVLSFFIANGADVNFINDEGYSPLFFLNDSTLLSVLLQNGADANLRERSFDRTPLMHHGINGTLTCEMFDLFLKYGSSVNDLSRSGQNLLMQIISSWNVRKIQSARRDEKKLLRKIVELTSDINLRDNDDNTVVHIAAATNVPVFVFDTVVNIGCDLNYQNKHGIAPIHLTCLTNSKSHKNKLRSVSIDHLRCLLSAGADINAQSSTGDTVLHLVVRQLAYKLNFHDRLTSFEKETEFYAFQRTFSAIELIMTYPIDFDLRNQIQQTALNCVLNIRSELCLDIISNFLNRDARLGVAEYFKINTICVRYEDKYKSWKIMSSLANSTSLIWSNIFDYTVCSHCLEFSGFVHALKRQFHISDMSVLQSFSNFSRLSKECKLDIILSVVNLQHPCVPNICDHLQSVAEEFGSHVLVYGVFIFTLSNSNYKDKINQIDEHLALKLYEDVELVCLMLKLPSFVPKERKINMLLSYLESPLDDDTLLNSVFPTLLKDMPCFYRPTGGETFLAAALKSPFPRHEVLQFLFDKGIEVGGELPLQAILAKESRNIKKTLTYDNLYQKFTFMALERVTSGPQQLEILLKNGLSLQNSSRLFDEIILNECSYQFVEKMINYGLDVNATDRNGQTLMHILCKNGSNQEVNKTRAPFNRLDLLRLFLSNVIDINVQDNDGNSPAHLLSMRRHQNGLEELLLKGSNANLQNNRGEICLHLAADNPLSVHYLLQYGADVTAVTKDRQTALHAFFNISSVFSKPNKRLLFAMEKRCNDIHGLKTPTLLLDAGIDINVQDKNGRTAFHLAMYFFDVKWIGEISRFFLRNGADVTIRDNDNRTVLDDLLLRMTSSSKQVISVLLPVLKTLCADNTENNKDDKFVLQVKDLISEFS